MKLSISNIAWDSSKDITMYKLMQKYKFEGLEIAPTRFFAHKPYEYLYEAKKLAKDLKTGYNLTVCSMQSILYGRLESIFESLENQRIITKYLFGAIDFAQAMSCENLVFGSPKNRCLTKEEDYEVAVGFFKLLGDYAFRNGTVMSIEANPSMYGTNFINYTKEAVKLVKDVDSKGFKLNLDFGTIIANGENIEEIVGHMEYINHVHISEPGLLPISTRGEHKRLASILKEKAYKGFISIEMKKGQDDSLNDIERAMNYIAQVFKY